MASSSVSQDSLDQVDTIELNARKSRIRALRARGALHKGTEREGGDNMDGRDQNGDHGGDRESPTRASISRLKDKRTRPKHLYPGKLPKDKRKLREKRRSTGVVHLQSTESTGDSLDEDHDDKTGGSTETKRNTSYNEVIDADNPQTPSDEHPSRSFGSRRNKSPSDLEADLEDNQDYDSAVSHSETNLTLVGKTDYQPSYSSKNQTSTSGSYNSYRSRYSPPESVPYSSSSPLKSSMLQSNSRVPSSTTTPSPYRSETRGNQDPADSNARTPGYYLARFQERRDESSTTNKYSSPRDRDTTFQSRFNRRENYSSSPRDVPAANSDEVQLLRTQLEKEKEENKNLHQQLDEKEKKIVGLEREVNLLNKDLDSIEEEKDTLLFENRALLKALTQLDTGV